MIKYPLFFKHYFRGWEYGKENVIEANEKSQDLGPAF